MKLRELIGLTLPGEIFVIWGYSDNGHPDKIKSLHNGLYSSFDIYNDSAVCAHLDRRVENIQAFPYDDDISGLAITLEREE